MENDRPNARYVEQVPWSKEEDAVIDAGILNSLSAAAMAEKLPGRTRNAVIGRAHRRKLLLDPDRAKKSRGIPKHLRGLRPVKITRAEMRKRQEVVCTPLEGVGIPFVEAIDRNLCTFFLEGQAGMNGHVCGDQRTDNSHYCAGHHQLAYQPTPVPQTFRRAA